MDKKLVRPKVNKLLTILSVVIVLMLINALYLGSEFYNLNEGAACNISARFNCIEVAKTEYAVLFGVPVAVWGVLFNFGLLIGVLGIRFNWAFWKIYKGFRPNTVLAILRYFSYFGLLFSMYLTYIEAFEIYVFCPNCLLQQFGAIVMVVLLVWINNVINKGKNETKICEFC